MSYQCPMCGEKLEDDLKVYMEHMESEIISQLKSDHPEWAEQDGTCLKCYEYYRKQMRG